MPSNTVEIVGDTGTLKLNAAEVTAVDPMEFRSGSFNGAVDERRVCTVFVAIPNSSKELTLRFEFTDPAMSTVDIVGNPVYLTAEDRVVPFTEPKGGLPERV